jgi:hypothetical protein
MVEDSEHPRKTGLSGTYPEERDPMRLAVREQARAQERNVRAFKQHWAAIQEHKFQATQALKEIELESKERDARLEKNVTTISTGISDLVSKVVVLETKLALFAALGGIVGAIVGSIITALVLSALKK